MMAYGAEMFEDRLMHARIKSRLNSLKGMVARTIIGGYVSAYIINGRAAAVLADVSPIELLIMEKDRRK